MRSEAARVLVGQDATFELLVVSLLAGGHVLLEGVRGRPKRWRRRRRRCSCPRPLPARAIYPPDLLPSDILGTNVLLMGTGDFRLREGPIFCDVLLADEINRAPS